MLTYSTVTVLSVALVNQYSFFLEHSLVLAASPNPIPFPGEGGRWSANIQHMFLKHMVLEHMVLEHMVLDHMVLEHMVLRHMILGHVFLEHMVLEHMVLAHTIDERRPHNRNIWSTTT